MTSSVFARHHLDAYPHRFAATILVGSLGGGIPTDPNVAEGWLRSKLTADSDDVIRAQVATTMAERGVDVEQAAAEVASARHLIGFKRDLSGGLYIEGRQVKACIKEGFAIAAAAGRIKARGWGRTSKGINGWVAEHIFVPEDSVPLGVDEPTGISQSFPKSRFGSSISLMEYVEGAALDFTVISDHDFSPEEWAAMWVTAEQNGIGAARSQGFGRFNVVRWDPVPVPTHGEEAAA